jgi:hypothetical protein
MKRNNCQVNNILDEKDEENITKISAVRQYCIKKTLSSVLCDTRGWGNWLV